MTKNPAFSIQHLLQQVPDIISAAAIILGFKLGIHLE